jgi:hypothetical protein
MNIHLFWLGPFFLDLDIIFWTWSFLALVGEGFEGGGVGKSWVVCSNPGSSLFVRFRIMQWSCTCFSIFTGCVMLRATDPTGWASLQVLRWPEKRVTQWVRFPGAPPFVIPFFLDFLTLSRFFSPSTSVHNNVLFTFPGVYGF